jgi:hypothetical protein
LRWVLDSGTRYCQPIGHFRMAANKPCGAD